MSSAPHSPSPAPHDDDEAKRPHVFDGIEEYDKRLPNWWLFTLYGAIAFSVVYWAATIQTHVLPTNEERVAAAMAKVEAARLADVSSLDDATLRQMSTNAIVIAAGKETFESTCAACHLASLRGKAENPAAVGPSLVDTEWIHGGEPMQVYHTVDAGVLEKGMPPWGPALGPKRISEVVAYILSKSETVN